jgi:hypothetical protein
MKHIIAAFGLLLAATVIGATGVVLVERAFPDARPSYGSTSDNVLGNEPSATKVAVGPNDTLVVSTSTSRTYLEITNISGATGTPRALYCNIGDRPSALYEGIVLFPSTTKAFNLDNLFRGALRCRSHAGTTTVTVLDN